MDFIKKLQLIERIDGMISRKSTGTPAELAKKIDVSERTLYNIISIMKKLGAPIIYSSTRLSYCYTSQVSFSYVYNIEDEDVESTPTRNVNEPEEGSIKKLHQANHHFRSASSFRTIF